MFYNIQMKQFKQQTISILKQQASELKLFHKQMQIKDEQIKFLKDTIINLEAEKQQLQSQLYHHKQRLKTIVLEVSTYNQSVVSKVHQDNSSLNSQLEQLRSQLHSNLQVIDKLTLNIRTLQQKNKSSAFLLQQDIEKYEQLQVQHNKKLQKLKQLQQNSKKARENQTFLTLKNEQLLQKVNFLNTQLQLASKKSRQVNFQAQKKLKQLKQETMSMQQYKKIQQNMTKLEKNLETSQRMLQQLKKQNLLSQSENMKIKQKLLSIELQNKLHISNFETDLQTLLQSLLSQSRIKEFQSKYSEDFEKIYKINKQLLQENCLLKDTLESYTRKNQELQAMVIVNSSSHEQLKAEYSKMKFIYDQKLQTTRLSSESKVNQLLIKIKKQQRFLHELTIKQQQYQQLSKETEKVVLQYQNLKRQSEQKRLQINNQNQILLRQINEMSELCEKNIQTKAVINKIKYILYQCLEFCEFLYLVSNRLRTKQKLIYAPFLNSFVSKRKDKTRRFRVYVWAIIAINRIQNHTLIDGKKNILKYARSFMKCRQNSCATQVTLQKMMNKIETQNTNLGQLLICTKNPQKWRISQYLPINIIEMQVQNEKKSKKLQLQFQYE